MNNMLTRNPSRCCEVRLCCGNDSVIIVYDLFNAILCFLIPFEEAAKISMLVKSHGSIG